MTIAALSEEQKQYRRDYYKANKAAHSARMKRWREANAESLKAKKKAYATANRKEISERGKPYARAYYAKNAERIRARERERRKQPKYMAINAEAARRRQTYASFADRSKVRAFYDEAQRLTLETGVIHHVDHIVPLKNKRVCGLHNEFNLRVITADENMRKKNKLIEDLT